LEVVGGRFGPQMVNMLVDSDETAVYLAKKFGVPDSLIRDEDEREAMKEQMMMAMQQQGGLG
jgi:glutathione S-transferase